MINRADNPETNPFEKFDAIFVVNLDQHLDRWVAFQKEASDYGFLHKIIRIPGVYNKVGSFGCAQAMKNALHTAKAMKLTNVLIFQDDAVFLYDRNYVWTVLNKCRDDIESSDIFYLGFNPARHGSKCMTSVVYEEAAPSFIPQGIYYGAFAIAVNRTAFDMWDSIPESLTDFKAHRRADNVVLHNRKLVKKVCMPPVVSVGDFQTSTGVALEKEGDYTLKHNHKQIPMAYEVLGLLDIPNLRQHLYEEALPEVSVVMPAFHTEDFIEEALDSVCAQHPLEVLVGVDNCVATLNKLQSIQHKYPMLKIFRSEENRGPFVMRNSMAARSSGDIIVFFDTDDVMKPGMLRTITTALKEGFDIVRYRLTGFKHGTSKEKGRDELWYAFGSIGITREAYSRAGGFRDWRCAADKEFITRCSGFMKIKCIPECLYWYRKHDHNLTKGPVTGMGSELRNEYHRQITSDHDDCFIEPVTAPVTEIESVVPVKISANMSTYPSGGQFLEEAVASILPHVDILRVYLNEYENRILPYCLLHPKIVFMRGKDLKSAGRMHWAGESRNELFFTVDDDIRYSGEYFRKHREYLIDNPSAVVSCHGRTVIDPKQNPYMKENWKQVSLFHKPLSEGFDADAVGVGVMAFDLRYTRFDLNEFPFYDVTDATVSAMCRDRGIKRYVRAHTDKELINLMNNAGSDRPTLWGKLNERLPRIDRVWQKDWSKIDA